MGLFRSFMFLRIPKTLLYGLPYPATHYICQPVQGKFSTESLMISAKKREIKNG
jgi:hypothetical protein